MPPRGRAKSSRPIEPDDPALPSDGDQQEDTVQVGDDDDSSHGRYDMRPKTRGRHPGVDAGLAKKTKEQISGQAQKKRDKIKEKAHRKQAAADRVQNGIKDVAALQNRKAQADQASLDNIDDPPGSSDEGLDIHDEAASLLSSLGPTNISINDAYEQEEEADFQSDSDSDPNALDDVSSHNPPAQASSRKVATHKTPAKVPASSSSSKTPVAKDKGKARAKPMTEAEKKKHRVAEARSTLQLARQSAVPASGPNKRSNSTSHAAALKKSKNRSGDAFTADYRQRLRDAAGLSTPTQKTAHPATSSVHQDLQFEHDEGGHDLEDSPKSVASRLDDEPDTIVFNDASWPTPTPSHRYSKTRTPRRPHATLSDEEIGGFNDEQVMSARPAASPAQPARMNPLVNVDLDAEISGDAVVDTAPKPKQKRAAKTHVPLAKSRGYDALPDWVKPTVSSKIIPSLVKLYGARDDPWDLDDITNDMYLKTLQALIKKLHPRVECQITRGHIIYQYTRQQVYEWRGGFQTLAIKLVKLEIAQKKIKSRGAIREWAKNAIMRGGEALYDEPNTSEPALARGAMQSHYLAWLVGYHLLMTKGTVIKAEYPVGALSLAGVAVTRAFKMYETGAFVADEDEFAKKYVHGRTQKMRNGSVAGLLARAHRFEDLLESASEIVPKVELLLRKEKGTGDEDAGSDEDMYMAVDPPTSPVQE